MHFFRKIASSTWFLAAIPSLVLMLFLSRMGLKNKLVLTNAGKFTQSERYIDLNSDSISENLHMGKGVPYYYILISDNDHSVWDQWNLTDSVDLDMADLFTGNYDHDRYEEMYFFTYRYDSLFLNINEFFDKPGTKADRLFITKIKVMDNQVTSIVYPAGFYDVNGDGFDELYFSIATGFGVVPRRLYYYDIVHRELKSSQFTGIVPIWLEIDTSADASSKIDIFGSVSSSANYKTVAPFSDWSSWLMIFDENLKLKFPPVEFPGYPNLVTTHSYKAGKFSGYVVTYGTGSADSLVLKPELMIFSSKGVKMKERHYSDFGFKTHTSLYVVKNKPQDRIFVLNSSLIELDSNLNVINKTTSTFNTSYTSYFVDIDGDGKKEFILYSGIEERLVIFNTRLQELAETKFKADPEKLKFSGYKSKNHIFRTFMTTDLDGYFLEVYRNKYYFLGYLAYPGIYFLFVAFIFLIKRINTLQIVQKESLNRRLVTLQLQGIKSQLDPHFTFNTLNSIASLIYLEDRQLAYDYMNKFTQLLRGLINDAERIYRSLSEELDFVTTYLDLEKLRFGDKFNYEIKIGEDVSRREQVPKLVLHTFAENAIKHGIMSRAQGGNLKISAKREKDYLILSVEDDGIGRQKANGQSNSTGKGLRLTREFYDILNQINKKPIKHFIYDLYNNNGDPAGTRIDVWVPVG